MPSSSSKGIAKNLFYKFADSLGLQKEDKPAPPPRPPQTWKPHEENLESAFNGLSLSSTPSPQPSSGSWSNAGFVGGFNPTFPVAQGLNVPQSPSAYFAPAPNLQPYAMPTPYSHQSLTMQMALQPESNTLKISRPHSTPLSTPPKLTAGSMSPSVSSGPSKPRPPASPSTPTKSNKSDTSDSPSRLSPKPGQEQCSGQTKAGNRCTRMVKIKPGDLVPYDGETPVERFCYQHQKEVLGERGYYSRLDNSKSLYVTFEIWIPSYLRPETQAFLRAEMDKPRSNSDVHGYIYAFEIREQSEGDTIKLKVGRAVNLNKRIDQWGKQCGSKEQILRGFFPPNLEDEEGNSGSLMKGRIKAGEKGPWCHRLERLIHLELTDLATSAIYLDPAWPNVDTGSVSSATESKALKKSKCQDCGTMHKEIFEFKRWTRGPNEGKEYEELVKRVIERWGKYVELYV